MMEWKRKHTVFIFVLACVYLMLSRCNKNNLKISFVITIILFYFIYAWRMFVFHASHTCILTHRHTRCAIIKYRMNWKRCKFFARTLFPFYFTDSTAFAIANIYLYICGYSTWCYGFENVLKYHTHVQFFILNVTLR